MGPCLLDNVLHVFHALRALRPCDPHNGAMIGQCIREIQKAQMFFSSELVFCFFFSADLCCHSKISGCDAFCDVHEDEDMDEDVDEELGILVVGYD